MLATIQIARMVALLAIWDARTGATPSQPRLLLLSVATMSATQAKPWTPARLIAVARPVPAL